MKSLFTSECVTAGHPDKVCDIISDSILDAYLKGDPLSRVAVETLVCQDSVVVAGEVTSKATIDTEKVIKNAISNIGYNYDDMKFNVSNIKITNLIHNQSPDIAMGVDINGAGDQGIMFGGAYRGIDDETLMPNEWKLSRELANQLQLVQKDIPGMLRPDGKTQVTLSYDANAAKPIVDTIVVSCQHDPNTTIDEIRQLITTKVINPVIDKYSNSIIVDNNNVKIHINPTGRFVTGGPDGDSGVTGRKIVVDGYGGFYPVGGGAFSGKDPTKVDRSAAYMARYLAYNIVRAGMARNCVVQLSYAIGIPQPTSLSVCIDGRIAPSVSEWLLKNVAMDPKSIIDRFDLRLQKGLFKGYADLATNGHFGRSDVNLPWEITDIGDILKKKFS